MIRLDGVCDVDILERALQIVLQRHEALHLRFSADGTYQEKGNPLRLEMPRTDLSSLSQTEQDQALLEIYRRFGRTPFDLANGPIVRLEIVTCSEIEHRLVVACHHIACDGWSWNVLLQEVGTVYAALYNGQAYQLDKVFQFSSYVVAELQRHTKDSVQRSYAYWIKQFEEQPPLIELPTDRTRPSLRSYTGGTVTHYFDSQVYAAIKDASAVEKQSLFTFLFSAFNLLLAKLSSQNDIVVTVPAAGQLNVGETTLVGYCVNLLPIRVRLDLTISFSDFLREIQLAILDAYDHQESTYSGIVHRLELQRDPSRLPLSEINFNMDRDDAGVEFGPLDVTVAQTPKEAVFTDLFFNINEHSGGLKVDCDFNRSLFDQSTIERWIGAYEYLLHQLATNPSQRLADVSLLTQTQRNQILVEWNNTDAGYPQDALIHTLFEEQAEKSPNTTAIVFENQQGFVQTITYGELNKRANQLANYLTAVGAGPDTLIGLCVHRSIDMMVGLLGILKAGAGYVPMDPIFPEERIRAMIDDAGPLLIITEEDISDLFMTLDTPQILIDMEWQIIAEEGHANLFKAAQPHNLAYVIYTSGSTGKPKGVQISHQSVVNFLCSMAKEPGLHIEDTILAVTTISFDIAVLELFLPLAVGAKVIIANQEKAVDAEWLIRTVSQATVMQATPATWQMLLSAGWSGHDSLRVLVGGEALSQELAEQLLERCHELWNMYGPTETTIWSSVQKVAGFNITKEGNDPTLPMISGSESSGTVSIGRPIANTQLYILDQQLQPVSVGVVGDLYIGGDGLARGYRNRPELTMEKFIENHLGGGRLYHTGDLARYRTDGSIDFLGRSDFQVKIRGFRIELGEIESVLARHQAIDEAVVSTYGKSPTDKQLVAYIRLPDDWSGGANNIGEIRTYLRKVLPEYMIPAYFEVVDAFPLTPNGKVNRRSLPEPTINLVSEVESLILPQTKAEKILAGAWTDLLGIEDIGVHSNFFEIGGHSLRAVQLITRLREQHGIEIGIRDIFRTPALVDLAKVLDPQVEEITQPNIDLAQLYSAPFKNRSSVFPVEATENTDFQSDGSVASSYSLIASPLKPVGREKSSHPVSAAQRRIWFLEELEEELVSFNLPFAVRLQGELNKEVLRRSVETIINRHEALRTTFTMEDGRPVQVIGPEQKLDIPVTDISDLLAKVRERQLTQLLSDDANRPFDLAEGPLFRTQLIRLAKEEHVFLFNVHHIVFDGWSLGCLYRELDVLYATYLDGKDASLPELPAQYVDFTYWQNERLESPELQRQLAYWTEQLAGAPPLLELPTDMPRPARQQYKGAALQKRISGELTTELRAFSHQQGASLFMTLFAGFQTLLHRYADQDDILIGSPVAGRNLSELEPLMGMFVNTLVLRTNFEDDPTFLELLQQVSVTSLDAFEHQEVPFEKLVEALQPQRSRSYSPLFQIMFVLQNTPQRVPDYIGTLGAWEETVEHRASMLDMTLYITELDEGMDLWLEYNTSLFAEKTIMRMLTHFEALLHGILQTPTARVSTIPLLSEAERERILIAWNDTSEPYPEACLHTLFDDLAIKMTNSVAAIFPSSQLTYGDLQKRSNQLANYLLNQGLSKGTLVGICAERSPEMLVGILGVLKAGGAYVPLDPYYPPDRLGFMMEDSGLSLLLTQQVLLDSLPKHNAQILCLDRDWRKIANSAQTTPAAIAQLDDPAYIIYTSGSTGSPKGVMGVHRATVNRCQWMWRAYPFRPDEVCSQKTSLNFVDSIWEIFGPLLQGIPTVYIPDAIVKDLNQFIRKLAKERVTRLVVVPSLLNTMLDAVPDLAAQLPKLSIWITSGETLTVELAAQFKRQLPDRLLLNLYGSSEVAADVTYYEVNAPEEQTVIPIGQPIANAQIYLVDTAMQPVPVGVVGELYVGGDVLAAGYLNRPELTDERFVPNPFGENESYLLYKTGDLGRYRSDGQIEYVGRTDHQVKIRGFRIELGEVESTLVADKQIQQAIVMVRAESSLGPQLVAYVVSDNEDEVYVKSICQQALPEYMVPSHIVFLTEMPLTPNGKVDRVALQSIELTMTQEETYVAPRNNIEEHLVYIWESLLDVRPIGVKDNFFDLGGHSLLAVQFLARVRDLTGEELALTTLLDSPSIERIANTLMARMPMDDETEQSLDQSVPPAREMTINGAYVEKSSRSATDTSGSPYLVQFEEGKPGAMPIFCVHGAGGNVLVLRELSRRLGADIPFYGIQARGVDGVSRPHSSIEGMAQAYINAIQTLQLDGPFILAGYSGGGTVAYEMARRLQGTDSQVPLVVFLDTFHPGIGEETTPLASHIKGLSRQGGEYLISKLTDRLEQRRVEKARKEKLTKLLSSSATIPIELRDYHLASNFITAMDHYSPRPYSGRILLFRAAETWPIYAHAGPDRGWSKLIPGLTIQEVPGDHENLILEPNVKTLAEAFKQSIDLLVT